MSLNSFRGGLGRITSTPGGKTGLFAVGAVLVFSLVYSGLGSNLNNRTPATASDAGTDQVATVNGTPITRAEFDQAYGNETQQMQAMGQPPPGVMAAYQDKSATLDQLVSQKLQLAAAEKMGLTASASEITAARQQAAEQSQIAAKLGLPANATVAQIDDALNKNGSQSLEEMLPDDALSQQIILQKLQASFAKPVSAADAQGFYKEYHTQHILIDNTKISDVQAQLKAQQILAKVKAPGADFGALARQYSDDPGTKTKGGDDGWIGEDNTFNGYIPEFVKAVQALLPGQVTPAPVKTPEFGYFLIKLDGIKENLPKDFAKNQAQYLDQIKQQRQQTALQNFQTGLKNDPSNKIVITDPALRGDEDLTQAQQVPPTQRPAKLQGAVAAYTQALKTASASDAGPINAALAQAYQGLLETPKAIAALKAAVDDTHDQQLELTLAQLYQQNGDTADAITQYQAASQQAWNDPQVHQQIAAAYAAMKQPKLAAQELAQAKQIQKRLAATAPASPGGLPPGLNLGGAGGAMGLPPGVTVSPTSGAPAPPAHAPGQ
jgi:parvulin-like peptidyl-prolyl isomerase